MIYGNKFEANQNSIHSYYSDNNEILNNDMTQSGTVWIDTSFNYRIVANDLGGMKLVQAENISAYHNNFVNSSYNLGSHYTTDLGYPTGGSYHIDYNGVDEKSGISQGVPDPDGIGDTAYYTTDYYPLMSHVYLFDAGPWGGENVYVSLESNSTISNFKIDNANHFVSFTASGNAGLTGFVRAEIPQIISKNTWGGDFQILVNGKSYPYTTIEGTKNDYAYVSYPNEATKSAEHDENPLFSGQEVPLLIVAVLLIGIITILSFLLRKKRSKNMIKDHNS